MKKNLIGAVLIFVAMLGLILWPMSPDLARYREMHERGQHQAVISQLEKELKKNPDWREARELLIWSALKGGRVDLALLHMAELAKAGIDIPYFEGQIDLLYSQDPNRPIQFPEENPNLLDAVCQAYEIAPHWQWNKMFFVGLLFKYGHTEEAALVTERVLNGTKGGAIFYSDNGSRVIILEMPSP